MSRIPNPYGNLNAAMQSLTSETPDFDIGTGTAGYTLPDDADISAAGTVAVLRGYVLEQNQFLRGLATELRGKALISPRGRPQ